MASPIGEWAFPERTWRRIFCGLSLQIVLIGGMLSVCVGAMADSWPQFLGPERKGEYHGEPLVHELPDGGPPELWEREVGQGFSGPAIEGERLILFHRQDDEEVVACLRADNGETLWTFAYPTDYRDDFGFDEGPRATPTIEGGRVYTHGAQGKIHCLEMNDGRLIWSVDTQEVFGSPKGFFGRVCSPLVNERAVLLNIGGKAGAGIVALDKDSGELLWKATDHEASYSSPVARELNGTRLALFFTRRGLVGLEPEEGRIRFQHRWRSRMRASVNAAAPIVVGDQVFLSACYGTGAVVVEIQAGETKEVWSGQEALSNHYATSLYRDGYLYGYHGRVDIPPDPHLRCVDFKTGEVQWSGDRFGAGSLLLADDMLVALKETGQLFLIEATPKRFQVLDRAQILAPTVRAYPALAGGRLYARNEERVACFDLRP